MNKPKFLTFMSLLLALAALFWGMDQANAQVLGNLSIPANAVGFNPVVNYNLANFAYSPNIRKFVDSLPGLGAPGCTLGTAAKNYTDGTCNQNNLGQYIPVAIPDKLTYPGDDFYDINVKQYSLKMHSDLPPTTLRGYGQTLGTGPGQTNTASAGGVQQYLGPLILARQFDPSKPAGTGGNGGASRLLVRNQLPVGAPGALFLPVDTTVDGAGLGPVGTQMFTSNRVTVPHLHGGHTPWISDGTPHQWFVPANETSIPAGATYDVYRKGMSFVNVPDMVGAGKSIPAPAPGDGLGTNYYTNQQSNRLLFWHDHAWGITRLNVYAGMAAPYLLVNQVEDDMIDGSNVSGAFTGRNNVLPNLGGIYRYGIPLVIQDKTFVNDATTPLASAGTVATPTFKTSQTDPLWATYVATAGGDLWYPHEYMPNENLYDPTGVLNWGRWDYGPWLNPPTVPWYLTLPSPTLVPESYGDTMIVNGTAFPYINLPPTAVRFRILGVGNERVLNLQFYVADPSYAPGTPGHNSEVKMVPATNAPALPFCAANAPVNPATGLPNGCTPATWPIDGRNGGVPDPTLAGPKMLVIGNEGGFLPQVAAIPSQPTNFEYSRRVPTMLNVTDTALILLPAERADIIVDLAPFAGKTLILYNDGPAPMPLFDERNEIYTGGPDWTAIGGAPSTPAGYGPNTRTVMQINVGPCPPAGCQTYDVAALQAALPQAYKATQPPPIVPQVAYNTAFGTANADTYVMNTDATVNLTGAGQPVSKVWTMLPGSGYTVAPTVQFVNATPAGSGAAATACLNGVTAITVTTAGTGYTTAPAVTFTGGGGTGAAAVAFLNGAGGVASISVTNPGCNYTTNPTINFVGAATAVATATANVTLGGVGAITVTNGGSGYAKAPFVFLMGGGTGRGATADAMLAGDTVVGMRNITEGFDPKYGRMNIMLGRTPVPLDFLTPAPQVPGIAQYIDPPDDYLYDGQTTVFRLAHLGVDSHVAHFHLNDLQVVNRVDFTNTLMPPSGYELGWKESIRTNPFTDLILAWRQRSPWLPFQIPNSSRLMDPSTVVGSTANYIQPAVIPGTPNPAGISNQVVNYGWEYVWHCHYLDHEEFDMMRPVMFQVTTPSSFVLAAPTRIAGSTTGSVNIVLTWPVVPNANQITIQRSTSNTFPVGPNTVTFAVKGLPPATKYIDTTVTPGTTYYYRANASNAAGISVWSGTRTIIATPPVAGAPAAPTLLTATIVSGTQAQLTWTNNAASVGGFSIQRSTNGGTTFTQVGTVGPMTGTGSVSYTDTGLKSPFHYTYHVYAFNGTSNSANSNAATVNFGARNNFSGIGKTEVSVYRAPGSWFITPATGTPYSETLGIAGDITISGDYDGDAMTDFAVFRPSTGQWLIVPSSTGLPSSTVWGVSTDIPVRGDFDGDGKADLAVFRPSDGGWYIIPSSTGVSYAVGWGISTDILVPGDYDGDGKTDLAVFRPSEGNWYILPSSTGVAYGTNWGISTDIPVPGDYDGDGKTDLAVFRAGAWYIIPSSTGVAYGVFYGMTGDVPAPGDYDGDGKTDIAVFRPSNGGWYIIPSSTGVGYFVGLGTPTDVPLP